MGPEGPDGGGFPIFDENSVSELQVTHYKGQKCFEIPGIGKINKNIMIGLLENAPKGHQGHPGNSGTPGTPGNPGIQGLPGRRGYDGRDGYPGPKGPPGLAGPGGVPGIQGVVGRVGHPGLPGKPGTPGTHGTPGRHGRVNYPCPNTPHGPGPNPPVCPNGNCNPVPGIPSKCPNRNCNIIPGQTGNCVTGNCQTGNCNTGNCQNGNCNTGNCRNADGTPCQTGCGNNCGQKPCQVQNCNNNCQNNQCNQPCNTGPQQPTSICVDNTGSDGLVFSNSGNCGEFPSKKPKLSIDYEPTLDIPIPPGVFVQRPDPADEGEPRTCRIDEKDVLTVKAGGTCKTFPSEPPELEIDKEGVLVIYGDDSLDLSELNLILGLSSSIQKSASPEKAHSEKISNTDSDLSSMTSNLNPVGKNIK